MDTLTRINRMYDVARVDWASAWTRYRVTIKPETSETLSNDEKFDRCLESVRTQAYVEAMRDTLTTLGYTWNEREEWEYVAPALVITHDRPISFWKKLFGNWMRR